MVTMLSPEIAILYILLSASYFCLGWNGMFAKCPLASTGTSRVGIYFSIRGNEQNSRTIIRNSQSGNPVWVALKVTFSITIQICYFYFALCRGNNNFFLFWVNNEVREIIYGEGFLSLFSFLISQYCIFPLLLSGLIE